MCYLICKDFYICTSNFLCVGVGERLTTLSQLSSIQLYISNTVLLTTATTLYIKVPECIHLITGSLHPLTNFSPHHPQLPSLWQPLTHSLFL